MQLYIHHDGQQQGPFDLELVRSRLADGSFQGSDLAWHEEMTEWMPLSAVLAQQAGGAVPPPVPTGQLPAAQTAGYAGQLPMGQTAGYADQPPQTSGLAIASLVLGLCSFLLGFLTGLPALICGHLSLNQIKKSGGIIKGRGMAITGLVIGYLTVLIIPVAILAGIALPVFNAVQMKGQQVKALAEAKQVGLACKLYAGDHDGKYPATLDELVPKYLTDKTLLVCHLTKGGPNEGYDYAGGTESGPAGKVLFSSQSITRDHKRVVIHVDGSGELARE